jgi:adenylosuccinate synthase
MPCTIIVGGQYGSEGKGKVTALLARFFETPWVVRCGGPNSGHTVTFKGKNIILRQVPSCPDHPTAMFLIAAGCVVDEQLLIEELDQIGLPVHRIIVDPRAVLLSEQDKINEQNSLGYISSTFSGTGTAIIRRMSRQKDVQLAKDSKELQKRCTIQTVSGLLHDSLEKGGNVLVEGTQGFGLSLLHSQHYPYVTSRDTTASGFAMEVGLSPRHIDGIIMVIRTFPIRVGGESGPLQNEITWKDIQTISGAPREIPELTSVTRKLRRVAEFDIEAVKTACRYNLPTSLAIMGLDRLDNANHGVLEWEKITTPAQKFVSFVEKHTGVPVQFVGTGFDTLEAVIIPQLAHYKELSNA